MEFYNNYIVNEYAELIQIKIFYKKLDFFEKGDIIIVLPILGNCVTVARQTLTLFVGVRIPIPQPYKGYKKDIAPENPDFIGVFTVYTAKFQRPIL